MKKLQSAGIHTAALLCPVIPYITDVTPLIDLVDGYAEKIWIYGLSITDSSDKNWQNVDHILEEHFPDVRNKIENAVFAKSHAY